MKNIFLRLMTLILITVVIVVGVGYLLPRDFNVEAAIEIAAPPAAVFEMVNELPNWQLWSTFSEDRIGGLKITLGEAKSGVGAAQTWTDARGRGKLWITNSTAPTLVGYQLNFGEFPTMTSRIEMTPTAQGTRVDWTSEGRLPSGPFYGYFSWLFAGQMTHEYQQCLQRLKQQLE